MKIVQAVGWYFPDTLGGTEVYVAGLCRRLRAQGHHVMVAAPAAGAAEDRCYEHEGVPVYRYPIPEHPTRDEAQHRVAVRGAERFHAWLASQRPDVVHFHTLVTGLDVNEIKVAKQTGARVIATTHSGSLGHVCLRGTMMRWGSEPCDGIARVGKCGACVVQQRGLPRSVAAVAACLPAALGRYARSAPGKLGTLLGIRDQMQHERQLQAELLQQVDAFVLLTQWAYDTVAANAGSAARLSLNRLGIGDLPAGPKPPPELQPTTSPIRVGYLGRFDPIKGVHDLARAVASLPRYVALRVEFRGPAVSTGERHVLRELQTILGEDPRVAFQPAVSAGQVYPCLRDYDLLCCPSVCVEGGPTVAIEAHAVGTPVIGTRIGGLAELVTDGVNGRLTPPGNWRALAGVLAAAANDPAGTIDHWRRVLPQARTMDQIAADYLEMYEGRS